MRLHSSSAAKKVQYQILKFPPLATKISWCSGYHISLQCRRTLVRFQVKTHFVSSLLLCSKKKYKIKNTQDESHMYIKNVSSLFLCSKKSTKSNLPRINITCTSKIRLNTHSVRTSKISAIF